MQVSPAPTRTVADERLLSLLRAFLVYSREIVIHKKGQKKDMIGGIFGLRIFAHLLTWFTSWILFDSFFLLPISNHSSGHLDLLLLFSRLFFRVRTRFHFCSISVPFDTPDQVTSGPYPR